MLALVATKLAKQPPPYYQAATSGRSQLHIRASSCCELQSTADMPNSSADSWSNDLFEEEQKASIKSKSYEPFRIANVYKACKKSTQRAAERVKRNAAILIADLDTRRRRA